MRLVNLIQFRNVVRRILKLQNCEKVGRVGITCMRTLTTNENIYLWLDRRFFLSQNWKIVFEQKNTFYPHDNYFERGIKMYLF